MSEMHLRVVVIGVECDRPTTAATRNRRLVLDVANPREEKLMALRTTTTATTPLGVYTFIGNMPIDWGET
jgi:hypothetical protein